MATVTGWNPFGVALNITATGGTVTRKSATQYTVKINVSWKTYYSGARTNYGMSASSGGSSATINPFGTYASSGSGTFTGTYSISGNAAASKTVTVTFKNFNSDSNKSSTKNVSFTVSVPAWVSYTIKYNANGGSGAPSSQTKWKDQAITLSSSKPTRTGYSFLGWNTSSSATTAQYSAGGKYTSNASVTLYAVWKANTYTIKYNANGGSGAPANQTKTYGVTLTLSSTKPTRTNYNFKGWSSSSSATTAKYSAGGSYTSNASITLYAVWELAYTKPRITSLSADRCDSEGNETDDGAYARVKFEWACDKDVSSIVIKWKLSSEKSYSDTDIAKVTASGKSGSVNQMIGSGSFDTDRTYDVVVTVTDTQGSSYKATILAGTKFIIDVLSGGNGVAFGKPAELPGYADFGFNACFVNDNKICGVDPSGNIKETFQPQNKNGNTVVGWSNYDRAEGCTNIYGHDVHLGVSNTAKPGTFRPYRRRGDSISVEIHTAGYVTNSRTWVRFLVPFTCQIVGSPTVTITSNDGLMLRQDGQYTHGSTGTVCVIPTSYTAVLHMYQGVEITATLSDLTNAINNAPVGVYWSGTITFT